jgi:hypothetical protein
MDILCPCLFLEVKDRAETEEKRREKVILAVADIGRSSTSAFTPLKPILMNLLYKHLIEMLIIYFNVSVIDLIAYIYNERRVAVSVIS